MVALLPIPYQHNFVGVGTRYLNVARISQYLSLRVAIREGYEVVTQEELDRVDNEWLGECAAFGGPLVRSVNTHHSDVFVTGFTYVDDQAYVESEARKKAIESKAIDLLFDHIDDTQQESLAYTNALGVVGSNGGRYRIRLGRYGNIDRVDSAGKLIRRYCVHPSEGVPDGDTILAQKLLIESDENGFLAIANAYTPAGIPVSRCKDTGLHRPIESDFEVDESHAWIMNAEFDHQNIERERHDRYMECVVVVATYSQYGRDLRLVVLRGDGLLQIVSLEVAFRVQLGESAFVVDGQVVVGSTVFGRAEDPIAAETGVLLTG